MSHDMKTDALESLSYTSSRESSFLGDLGFGNSLLNVAYDDLTDFKLSNFL